MNTVCLIHPPHPNSTDDRLEPPVGLLSIAAHLERQGTTVSIADLSGRSKEEWSIPVADIYGITVYVSTLGLIQDIIGQCKKNNPNSRIVVGGAHPSSCSDDFPYVDHVVVGPGEVAMCHIALGCALPHIIVGLDPKDYFLFPAFHLIEPASYHRTVGGKPSLPLLSSRGCPFKCAFCGLNRLHELERGKVVYSSPENVYAQMKRVKEEFGIDRINFNDEVFTLNPKRLFRILDLIRPLGIKFKCMGHARSQTEEIYRRLAEAGCEQIAWGMESGSQYMLDRMRKQVRVEENRNVIKWAKKYGITSRTFFIIGFPGETEDTVEETKRFIMEADPDQYSLSNFVPYPGTEVWANPEKFGIVNMSKDYSQYYQFSKDGTGGVTTDTQWLSRDKLRGLELNLREWLKKNKEFRGPLQGYERKLQGVGA